VDDVIDYTQDDFVRTGRHWDVIVETAGAPAFSDLRDALTPKGALVKQRSGHRLRGRRLEPGERKSP